MIPMDLRERLERHGQQHLLEIAAKLADAERANLLRELQAIDFAELQALHARREQKDALPERECIQPLPRPALADDERARCRRLGEKAYQDGAIAFLVVAGGQGTRLGFDAPKGMFPIGPISKKSLFQLHAEKVLALCRRTGKRLPLIVMTSPATDEATRKYFKRKNYFRLPPQDVGFFCQGTMPAVDLATGRLLLEAPGRLCLSPNGHGGTITGLAATGFLERLVDLGIRSIYYFQVDNPLVNLGDYLFVGRHLDANAEVSSKVLPKTGPMEKVGNFALVDGRCAIIEYSDLPDAWAHETNDLGELTFWAGNPAIHLFDVAFLRKIASEASRLPWHLARKKVPHLDASGKIVMPEKENALKFERFIFDILPQAERWTVLPTAREEEFAPVKNKEGVDSPATAQAMMIAQWIRWMREFGAEVSEGVTVEISPLMAMDVIDLEENYWGDMRIARSVYLNEPQR